MAQQHPTRGGEPIRASSSAVPAASTISPLAWVSVAPNSGRLVGDRVVSLTILRAEILGKPADREAREDVPAACLSSTGLSIMKRHPEAALSSSTPLAIAPDSRVEGQ